VHSVSQKQTGPNLAVAQYLKDTGHDRGTMLVHSARIKEYLPKEARVLDKVEDAQGKEVEVVIINRNSYRPRQAKITDYLESNRDRFEHSYTRGNMDVYTRKPEG
jgi:hypothetical protein